MAANGRQREGDGGVAWPEEGGQTSLKISAKFSLSKQTILPFCILFVAAAAATTTNREIHISFATATHEYGGILPLAIAQHYVYGKYCSDRGLHTEIEITWSLCKCSTRAHKQIDKLRPDLHACVCVCRRLVALCANRKEENFSNLKASTLRKSINCSTRPRYMLYIGYISAHFQIMLIDRGRRYYVRKEGGWRVSKLTFNYPARQAITVLRPLSGGSHADANNITKSQWRIQVNKARERESEKKGKPNDNL